MINTKPPKVKNKTIDDYYLGLDIGTNSVGWAVTDRQYNVIKLNNKPAWGVRLFDEAQTAAQRRLFRSARRRTQRMRQRILWLNEIFEPELNKVDSQFIKRLEESKIKEDYKKEEGGKYFPIIFPSRGDEIAFYKKYPTIFHLKKAFLDGVEDKYTTDIRCLYLVVHHYFKARGNFLLNGPLKTTSSESGESTFDQLVEELSEALEQQLEIKISDNKQTTNILRDVLLSQDSKNDKSKKITEILKPQEMVDAEQLKSIKAVAKLLSGGTSNLSELFQDENLTDSLSGGKLEFSKTDYDEKRPELELELQENIEIVDKIKAIFDFAILEKLLGGKKYISEARIESYNQYKKDLQLLKQVVKTSYPNKKHKIFNLIDEKVDNYARYTGKKTKTCSQENLCKFLKSELFSKTKTEEELNSEQERKLFNKITENNLCTKQRNFRNGVIPNQIYQLELDEILKNAFKNFSFLGDIEGSKNLESPAYKLKKILSYRIPYFVGPLTGTSETRKMGRFWMERNEGQEKTKVTPWNFSKVVNLSASATNFINNLTSYCSYLKNEKVLPKQSLLYQKYTVLNELNNLKINGEKPSVEVKQQIFEQLFQQKSKVTINDLKKFFKQEYGEIITKEDISGIDNGFSTSLSSYLNLKDGFSKLMETDEGLEIIDDCINLNTIFGTEKVMLTKKIKQLYSNKLTEDQIKQISSKKFTGWGALSKAFLTKIKGVSSNGDSLSSSTNIVSALWETNHNLMELLSENNFSFNKEIQKYNQLSDSGTNNDPSLSYELVEDLYVSPAVRRAIWQTLKIVDEIKHITGKAPKKIFIESTRDASGLLKGRRTSSRRKQLQDLYKVAKDDKELLQQLNSDLEKIDDGALQAKKMYLYFLQMGKSAYTGKKINLSQLMDNNIYDIDHIFPRSLTKDDSFDNLVLVEANLNRSKTDKYPIDSEIQTRMSAFWSYLLRIGAMSRKKYDRLVRKTPLSMDELAEFINRQLVFTSQANKEVKNLLNNLHGENTKVIFSKAGLVSDFRKEFDLLKCRTINNFHHAHDAYLNIVVGNTYNTKFTDNPYRFVKNNYGSRSYTLKPEIFWRNYDVNNRDEIVWERTGTKQFTNIDGLAIYDESKDRGTIVTVRRYLSKPNVLITRMLREGKEVIPKVTIEPVGKNSGVRIKKDMPIEKYGGYNSSGTAYFCCIKHTVNNKEVVSVESITVIDKAEAERDLVSFFESKGLKNVSVVIPKILIGSLFKFNNSLLTLTGRSGTQIVFSNANELYANKKLTQYIRKLEKLSKNNSGTTADKLLSNEKNIELYNFLFDKMNQPVYKCIFSDGWINYIKDSYEIFLELSLEEQGLALLEIIKFFTSNADMPKLEFATKSQSVSRIRFSKNLNPQNQMSVVNQSITGLYQNETALMNY